MNATARIHPDPCPRCGGKLELRHSHKLNRPFYGCERFPACKSTAGAHPDGRPLGTAGDEATKAARRCAHEAFDPLWKRGRFYSRGAAYKALAAHLGLQEAHIGAMRVDECLEVVKWSVAQALRPAHVPTMPEAPESP